MNIVKKLNQVLSKRVVIVILVVLVTLIVGRAVAMTSDTDRIESTQTTQVSKDTPNKKEAPETSRKMPEPTAPAIDPNGCEAKGQWYRADNNECIPKTIYQAPAVTYQAPVIRSTSGVEQWRGLVASYFPGEVDYALAIMKCESGGNALAHSPTNDYGLMQINGVHAAQVGGNLSALYDPATNLRVAASVRAGSGWAAWSCSHKV